MITKPPMRSLVLYIKNNNDRFFVLSGKGEKVITVLEVYKIEVGERSRIHNNDCI